MAVSGFSGTILSSERLPPGVNPIDRTFIDPGGASLRIFDLSTLAAPVAGQIVNAPVQLAVPARDIGQVFGLSFDEGTDGGPPNLYVAATSAYGIRIVGAGQEADGKPVRLKQGAADARFMDGQFGALASASPGAIYKIDGTTGEAAYFADTAFSGVANSGPGLGAIVYDAQSNGLYASDLDTGLIHHFGLNYNAADLDQFDHGIVGRRANNLDPIADDGRLMEITSPSFKADDISTWGLTQPERRVNGLAVHNGRLYYAVAAGPEIWSVAIHGGAFVNDARLEMTVKAAHPFPVTGIAFDGNGRMLLSQRGTQKNPYDYSQFVDAGPAQVLRYAPKQPDDPSTPGLWKPEPDTYAIGPAEGEKTASGGISLQYGYRPDGSIDLAKCWGSVAITGDELRGGAAPGAGAAPDAATTVHGVQLSELEHVRSATVPPKPSAFIDYDVGQDAGDVRGHVGDVRAFRRCDGEAGPGFPPVVESGAPATGFPPVLGSETPGTGFPPVESPATPPPVVDATAPVDPNAPNMAIQKSQNCRLVGAAKAECEYRFTETNTGTTPFEHGGGAIEDVFSVPPATFVWDGVGGVAKTANGFRMPIIESAPMQAKQAASPPPFKATFVVPPGGLTVENCISLSFAPAGTPVPPAFTAAEKLPDQADLPASTTNGFDRAIAISGAPQCIARGNVRDCTWNVTVSNPGTVAVNFAFTIVTSKPALRIGAGIGGVAVTRKNDTTTVFSGDSLAPKAVKSVAIKASFALEPGNVTATASVDNINVNDLNPANDKATAAAGTAAPQILPSTAKASADANPADNTSCVKWDSNKPNDQGTPTKGPTVPGQPPPATPPPPAAPVPQAAQLKIEKKATAAQCSDAGGGCDFEITVTNSGAAPFTGPIEIDESVKGDGAFFGGTAITSGPNAPWTCAKTGQSFACSHPSTTLAPNGSVTLKIGFKLGAGTAAKEIENCAALKGQGGAACVKIPLIQGPKLKFVKTATQAFCNPTCAFTINVTNIGNAPFNGPIEVIDFPTGVNSLGGALIPELVSVGPAPWTCTKPGNFLCVRPGPLGAGETVTLSLTLKYPPTQFKAQNCVGQANIVVDEMLANQSCAAISNLPPPNLQKLPNIRVEKQAPNAATPGGQGACVLGRPCRFTIIVSNTGDADYKGKIRILDDTSNKAGQARAPDSLGKGPGSPAQWSCTSITEPGIANTIACEHPEITLVKGSEVRLEVMVVVGNKGGVWKKDDVLVNCAQFSYQFGNDKGGIKGDDRACASVKLDPYALKISKSGDQSCPPGSNCRFEITIFNPGPIDHNAPVTITDGLSNAPPMQIVSIVPPLPCAVQPTRIPFSCTTPGDFSLPFLDPPAGRSYTMIVRVPQGVETFTNCAIVSTMRRVPATGEDGAATAVRGQAAGQSTSESSDCHAVEVRPKKSETRTTPICSGGMFMTAEGLCACPPGQSWSGSRCVETRREPPPQRRPQSSSGSNRVQTPESCPSSRPIGTPPNCCPRGTTYKRGACREIQRRDATPEVCPSNRPIGRYPDCCPRGTEFRRGACRESPRRQQPGKLDLTKSCPDGSRVPLWRRCPRSQQQEPPARQQAPIEVVPKPREPGPSSLPQREGPIILKKCPSGTTGVWPSCSPIVR